MFRATILTGLLMWSTSVHAAAPRLATSAGEDLQRAREVYRAGQDEVIGKAIAQVIARADKALSLEPPTVISKPPVDVTDDPHEYASLSPYWWPDPEKPDGRPYIRRDGEFNPERDKFDLGRLETMSNAVRDLGMAYYFTGEEKYAEKAATMVRVWFIDPATKMNPSLKYAQFVPGYTKPRPSGIIEGLRFRRVIDGVAMIAGSSHWSENDEQQLEAWFDALTNYLLTSEQGQAESAQANNHGTWSAVQIASYALYVGKDEMARELIEKSFKHFIASQLTSEGMQPEEAVRTLSFHYHRYNLLGLFDLAMLGDRVGLDLWRYQTEDGKSIRLALDYMTPFATQQQPWPHKQIRDIRYSDMIEIYRRAANVYNEPSYERIAQSLRQHEAREMTDVVFPSKLK